MFTYSAEWVLVFSTFKWPLQSTKRWAQLVYYSTWAFSGALISAFFLIARLHSLSSIQVSFFVPGLQFLAEGLLNAAIHEKKGQTIVTLNGLSLSKCHCQTDYPTKAACYWPYTDDASARLIFHVLSQIRKAVGTKKDQYLPQICCWHKILQLAFSYLQSTCMPTSGLWLCGGLLRPSRWSCPPMISDICARQRPCRIGLYPPPAVFLGLCSLFTFMQ